MELPTKRQEVTNFNPSLMLWYGRPKSGKSTIAAALDDCLVIDLEDGYRALEVMRVNVRTAKQLYEVKDLLHKKALELKKKPYKYIVIDNATRLEEMANPVAVERYRNTPQGEDWKCEIDPVTRTKVCDKNADIRDLPRGLGYMYIRDVVQEFINMFRKYCTTLILIAHQKERQINEDGEELMQVSVDLPGKLEQIVCGMADAIGYIYRRENKTYMSFEGGDDRLKEARPLHLRGKKFVVAESDDDNNVHVDLSKIFI